MGRSKSRITKTPVVVVPEVLPTIWHVAKLIAYDNGMINRGETEDQYLTKVANIISSKPIMWCLELEEWLKTKNPIEQNIIAAGEYEQMMEIIKKAPRPAFTDNLFNQFFEGE